LRGLGEAEGAGAEGVGSAVLLRLNHDPIFDALGDAEAAGVALAPAKAFLRVRCSDVAEGEAEAAGLVSVLAFLRARRAVAEGEAVALGLAAAVASVFLWVRCLAGEGDFSGVGLSVWAKDEPAKATAQRRTKYFVAMAHGKEAARWPSITFHSDKGKIPGIEIFGGRCAMGERHPLALSVSRFIQPYVRTQSHVALGAERR
jgi:hypothetical protein